MSGRVGHRLSRAIVHGGTESAGHDDHLGSLHGCVNGRDDILPFITDDRFESNGDPELAEFVGKEERVGIGSAPDQQFRADRDGFCGESWFIVVCVRFVWFVSFRPSETRLEPEQNANEHSCLMLVNLAKISW